MPLVYVNGDLVPEERASVSALDHGFVVGDGVFESILVEGGRPFALAEHLDRLEQSAALIDLPVPERAELVRAVDAVVSQDGAPPRAKLRLTVTSGTGPLGSGRGSGPPSVVAAVSALGDEPLSPATVVVVPWPRNERSPLAGAKTTSYAENVVALAWAAARGADEALFLNLAGNLCEGTGSNVFLAFGDELVTPPLSAGCLAGVTRRLLLEATGAREVDVAGDDLVSASEAFLTSTTRGVQPIARLDGRTLPVDGPQTEAARVGFERLVARLTASPA